MAGTSNIVLDSNRRILRAGNGILAVAQIRSWDIPKSVTEALAMCQQLASIRSGPVLPGVGLPAKAADLRDHLAAHALAVEEDRQLRAVATEALAPAASRFYGACRDHLPIWLDVLADEFSASWSAFTTVAPSAPFTIEGGPVSEEAVTAYSKTATAAAALDEIVGCRATLGRFVAEDGCDSDRNVGLVAVMPPLPQDPSDFMAQWERLSAVTGSGAPGFRSTLLHQQLTLNAPEAEKPAWAALAAGPYRWRRLMDHAAAGWTVSLARAGQVEARIADLATWQSAAWQLNVSFGGTRDYINNTQAGRYRVTADRMGGTTTYISKAG
ncbi:MAG TPA: hypothetical protein VFC57_09700 [Aeromicrobium sp.]|nr:hypothetical protein [Aeromicrobium sp.]